MYDSSRKPVAPNHPEETVSPTLLIRTRDGGKSAVPLSGQLLTLGRFHENDVSFPDDRGLSRRHMVLEKDGDEWVVSDVGSKNGTFINGSRLEGKHRLRAGDVISAGRMTAVLSDETGQVPAQVEFLSTPVEALTGEGTLVASLDGALAAYTRSPAGGVTAPAAARRWAADSGALGALVRAGLELAARRPLPELFSLILELSMEVVGAQRGVVLTLEHDELVVQALRGEVFRISTAVRDRVLQSRLSMLVRDTIVEPEIGERASIGEENVRSLMAVPLQTAGRVIGLIYVDWSTPSAGLTGEALDLLTVFGNIAATRIEQERLQDVEDLNRAREQELEQAAEIQRGLLPGSPPPVAGMQLAGSNVPSHMVGGDYFDFLPLERGQVALAIGDVSGTGMPAALLMVDLRARLQVLIAGPVEPAAMMAVLDRHMEASCPRGRFVTFFLSVVDPATGRMCYCNAGHNPPYVVRKDGRVERLEICGLPLGMMPGGSYRTCESHLDCGDLLVLYSDGVSEAPDPAGVEFGEERLERLLLDLRTAEAPAIVEGIRRALQQWTTDVPPADDVTVLVAKRT
jgi:serine phosphatase RsbU (regulator of sigma subunit)